MRVLLDLLVPPRCLSCQALTGDGRRPLCEGCHDLLEPDGEGHLLDEGVVAAAPYAYADPLATAIKRVKTDGLREGAEALGALLHPHLPAAGVRTWIPAPPGRRRRRGLNLPELLAGPTAVPLLRTTRTRPDQPDLDAAGRRRAVIGSYAAIGAVAPGIVLVDDVRATGATLLAAADALRHAGARRILAVTLAASPGVPSASRTLHPDGGSTAGSARSW